MAYCRKPECGASNQSKISEELGRRTSPPEDGAQADLGVRACETPLDWAK
jgi:hypothetical protein